MKYIINQPNDVPFWVAEKSGLLEGEIVNLTKILQREEGLRTKPYCDSTGKEVKSKGNVTIGIGRNLTAKGLNEDEIRLLYFNDIVEYAAVARSTLDYYQTVGPSNRRVVILACIFHHGIEGFSKFVKFGEAIKKKDFVQAGKELLDSKTHKDLAKLHNFRMQRMAQMIELDILLKLYTEETSKPISEVKEVKKEVKEEIKDEVLEESKESDLEENKEDDNTNREPVSFS